MHVSRLVSHLAPYPRFMISSSLLYVVAQPPHRPLLGPRPSTMRFAGSLSHSPAQFPPPSLTPPSSTLRPLRSGHGLRRPVVWVLHSCWIALHVIVWSSSDPSDVLPSGAPIEARAIGCPRCTMASDLPQPYRGVFARWQRRTCLAIPYAHLVFFRPRDPPHSSWFLFRSLPIRTLLAIRVVSTDASASADLPTYPVPPIPSHLSTHLSFSSSFPSFFCIGACCLLLFPTLPHQPLYLIIHDHDPATEPPRRRTSHRLLPTPSSCSHPSQPTIRWSVLCTWGTCWHATRSVVYIYIHTRCYAVYTYPHP